MITFIAHLRVPAVNVSAFEELMTTVATTTTANEPGVIYYGFARSVEEPDTYVVIEIYRDQEAVVAHGDTAWVRESVPKSLELIEGMPQLAQYVSPGVVPVESRFEDLT
jgi:quinol monooxygenase YgiN